MSLKKDLLRAGGRIVMEALKECTSVFVKHLSKAYDDDYEREREYRRYDSDKEKSTQR